jgi:hypothetical protein
MQTVLAKGKLLGERAKGLKQFLTETLTINSRHSSKLVGQSGLPI